MSANTRCILEWISGLASPNFAVASWGADPGTKDDFGVVLQAFDETNVGMLNPGMERFDGLRFCRTYLAHVIAFIKTDRRPFQHPFDAMALQPDAPLVIIRKNFSRSPERRIMSRLVLDEHQKREARRRV